MPRFRLIPTDKSVSPIEYEGANAGSAFTIANQMGFAESELWHAEQYICTLRRMDWPEGAFWQIMQDAPQAMLRQPAEAF